jgi:hypothetical protein
MISEHVDEDKLRRDADRGFKAQSLLENELLKETFDYLEDTYKQAWSECKTTELREANWFLLKALQRVQQHLITTLSDGKLADMQISELVARAANRRRAA